MFYGLDFWLLCVDRGGDGGIGVCAEETIAVILAHCGFDALYISAPYTERGQIARVCAVLVCGHVDTRYLFF